MAVYYNEHDPKKAAWLRELIKSGLVAPGDVDERSIADVRGSDLAGYEQCHFFAGIGVWSYALRLAGWPDDRQVWTGSCPCQPFSAAGQRKGTADERHLWPELARLIRGCRPIVVVGEQVASKDGLAWLDDVFTDLEATAYTTGAVDSCAAGFGAPHIRQRLYWVAYSASGGRRERGDATQPGSGGYADGGIRPCQFCGYEFDQSAVGKYGCPNCEGCGLGDPEGIGRRRREDFEDAGRRERAPSNRSATNGFWRDAEWVPCRDGKARPVEPGTSPLAYGAAARVVRLRGYGDAIVAPQAEEFIRAVMEEIDTCR